MTTRIAQLRAFLAEDPDDPFLCYSLGLEYVAEQPGEADRLFSDLLLRHPDYLATYYQAALLKIHQGQLEEAKRVLKAGIAIAKEQANPKTANELRHLLEGIAEE